MIKKTGVSLENSNLEKATQEFQEVNFIEEDLAGLGSIDTDKTYSDIQFMDFNNGSSKTIYNFRHSSSKVYEQGINQDRLQATAGTPQTYTDNTFGDRTFNTYNMEPNISKDFSYSKIEKITSEIGNSTISNMYNLANFELNNIDDKENQFRQNQKPARDTEPTSITDCFKNQAIVNTVCLNQEFLSKSHRQINKMRKIQSNLQGAPSEQSVMYFQNKNSSFQISPNQNQKFMKNQVLSSCQALTNSNFTIESNLVKKNNEHIVCLKHPASDYNLLEQAKNLNAVKVSEELKRNFIQNMPQMNLNDSLRSQLSFGFQNNPTKNNYYNKQAKRVKERTVDGQTLEQYISLSSLGVGKDLEIETQKLSYFQKQQNQLANLQMPFEQQMNCIPEKLTLHPSGYKAKSPNVKEKQSLVNSKNVTPTKTQGKTVKKIEVSLTPKKSTTPIKNSQISSARRYSALNSQNKSVNKVVKQEEPHPQIEKKSKNPKVGRRQGPPIWERLYSIAKSKEEPMPTSKSEIQSSDNRQSLKNTRKPSMEKTPKGNVFEKTYPVYDKSTNRN